MNEAIIGLMDHLLVESRIRDLAHYALGNRNERLARISAILSQLTTGWYLVGLGPHFSEIVRVGNDPVLFGRPASLLESSSSEIIDYSVNDATLMGPREVSRSHMSARVDVETGELAICDEGSSTGTWLGDNHEPLEAQEWTYVDSGSVISLGASRTNVLVCVKVDSTSD